MTERTFPNLGLKGGYDPGENGWGDAQNLNLLTISILTQGTVIDKVSAEPGSPSAGDVYLLDEAHGTHPNEIIVFDGPSGEEEWVYVAPNEGWLLYNQTADYYEKFDGAVWAELATGGGGGVEEAPEDGDLYARKDGGWESFEPGVASSYPFCPSFYFEAILGAGERYGKYVASREVTFPADFAGSVGHCASNPAATFAIDIKVNGVSAGTVSISTSGVFTFSTVGGVDLILSPGDRLTVHGPASAGTSISGCAFTLDGEF